MRAYKANMIPGGTTPTINVSQYDNDYAVTVTLFEGTEIYTPPAGATIRVEGTKPDGHGFEYPCTYQGNVVTMPIYTQMTVLSGRFPIELVVYQSGLRVGSCNIIFAVEKATLGEDTDISETVIPDIIAGAQAQADAAAASATAAASSAASAETAKDAAIEAAQAAAQSAASLTVDTELSSTSTNPVQNKVIDATVTELKNEITKIKGIVYKKGNNLIDFGIIGNTWIQGSWDNGSNPYTCHTDHIDVANGHSKIYIAFNKQRFETETGYDSNGVLYVIYFDANDAKIGQNSASSQYQGPYEHTIPSGTSYIVLQISTSIWGNSLTPAILDSITSPFAYAGYNTVNVSDIPTNYIPYPEDNDERITKLETNVATIIADSATINDKINNVSIFEKSDTPETLTQGSGYYQTDGTLFQPTSTQFLHYDLSVSGGEKYSITGFFTQDSRFVEYIFFDANNGVISYAQASADGNATVETTVPNGTVKMGINSYGSYTAECYKYEQENTQEYIAEQASYWYGKKIVWFGTSIPAGVVNAGGAGGNGAYPTRIGEILGATVYNESIGSSRVRGGNYHAISADDPMGWGGCEAIGVMLSMSLSRAEKQAIIDSWDSKWKDIMLEPSTYNPDNIAGYLDSSWDTILTKYLTGGSVGQCDLYVFDHGYNDGVVTYGFSDLAEIPAQQDDRTYWCGAMNFLIGKILADNPKAKILIIGHYNYSSDPFNRGENWAGKYVCDAQKAYAESWGLSCVETWKLLGLTMNTINIDGTDTPVIYARYPDHLHPASDSTGYELTRYADALAPYVDMARGT